VSAPVAGVMGRLAVWVSTVALAGVGVATLFGCDTSAAIDDLGPEPLDVLWSLALIGAGGWQSAAMLAARTDEEVAVVLERAAALCLLGGLAAYMLALIHATAGDGAIMVLALTGSLIVNVAGRQWLLYRRARAVLAEVCVDQGAPEETE